MAFSRPLAEKEQLINVEAVLDSTVNLAWNEIRHRARLVKLYGRVPEVRGNETRLSQMFLNLIVNAAQSFDDGAATEAEIALRTALDGDRVVVEVADTGAGIGEQDLPHVFEPFFTTKRAGAATGLGLAICQNIVTSHGGDIAVRSRPGQGATFRVSLPVAREAVVTQSGGPVPGGQVTRARILVIDDEPLLGQTLSFAFAGRHEVVVTSSGREALGRLAEDAEYDLVLCDLMMPDIPGQKVFEAVARDYPSLVPRFVFMTGGAFTDSAQEFLERHPGRHIDKPFTIAEIERLLGRMQ